MSHEATHVATEAATSDTPLWLLEGFADYVALRDVDLPLRVSAGQIIAEVRRDGPPRGAARPPRSSTPDHAHLGAAYESAWLACACWPTRRGGSALVDFYRRGRRRAERRSDAALDVRRLRRGRARPARGGAGCRLGRVSRRRPARPARPAAVVALVGGLLGFVVLAAVAGAVGPGPRRAACTGPPPGDVFTAPSRSRGPRTTPLGPGLELERRWRCRLVVLVAALGFTRLGTPARGSPCRGPWWVSGARLVAVVARHRPAGHPAVRGAPATAHRVDYGLSQPAVDAASLLDQVTGVALSVVGRRSLWWCSWYRVRPPLAACVAGGRRGRLGGPGAARARSSTRCWSSRSSTTSSSLPDGDAADPDPRARRRGGGHGRRRAGRRRVPAYDDAQRLRVGLREHPPGRASTTTWSTTCPRTRCCRWWPTSWPTPGTTTCWSGRLLGAAGALCRRRACWRPACVGDRRRRGAMSDPRWCRWCWRWSASAALVVEPGAERHQPPDRDPGRRGRAAGDRGPGGVRGDAAAAGAAVARRPDAAGVVAVLVRQPPDGAAAGRRWPSGLAASGSAAWLPTQPRCCDDVRRCRGSSPSTPPPKAKTDERRSGRRCRRSAGRTRRPRRRAHRRGERRGPRSRR